MPNNKTQDTKISTANNLYKKGAYHEALQIYKSISEIHPALSGFISINIKLCETALLKIEKHHSINPTTLNTQHLDAHDTITLLSHPLKNTNHQLPTTKYILHLLKSIDHPSPTHDHFKSSIICALSSPFQRDLLWHVAALAQKLNSPFGSAIENDSETISLYTTISMASNSSYWLLNREKFRQWIIRNNITDPRAWDLFQTPPDTLTPQNTTLPEFRAIRTNTYAWDKKPTMRIKNISHPYSIALGTILLNEKKFIGLNLLQHYKICDSWSLIEGACQGYPTKKVTDKGLSLDNCSAQIRVFPDPDFKIRYIQHGWTSSTGEDAKSEMRNRYLENCNSDFLLVIDADEFYIEDHIISVIEQFEKKDTHAIILPQVHFWKNTENFITGEYYDISHTRLYRNHPGMSYIRNHNFPEIGGEFIHDLGRIKIPRTIQETQNKKYKYLEPCCYHMGFAKDYDDMRDKTDYYINRGEATTRKSTTASRAAWFGDDLPEKCKVRAWGGDLPSVLIEY